MAADQEVHERNRPLEEAAISDFSERDRELLAKFGMTEEQVERDERMAESETEPDGLTGRVHYGMHLDQPDEEMISVSIRVSKSTLDELTETARRYHISRSEYMRRKLAAPVG